MKKSIRVEMRSTMKHEKMYHIIAWITQKIHHSIHTASKLGVFFLRKRRIAPEGFWGKMKEEQNPF